MAVDVWWLWLVELLLLWWFGSDWSMECVLLPLLRRHTEAAVP